MFENEKFEEILTVLRNGGVILFPTDTIWGIGCDATNENAVGKLLSIKKRAVGVGVVVLVDSIDQAKLYVDHVHPRVETLLMYHERPLTVVYEEGIGLASNCLAKDGSVALRVTQDPFCAELIRQFGKPIVASAANIDGKTTPKNFGGISSDILENVDMVVRYKQDIREMDDPSVIVRLNEFEELDFIRE